MKLTPNLITLFRIAVAFTAVCLYGRNPWANLIAVALTVAAIALDAFDGYIARKRNLATPRGARRPQRLGTRFHDANVVGPRAGRLALEPRRVRGHEVRLLLLPRPATGARARAGGDGGNPQRLGAGLDGRRRPHCRVGHRGVLHRARLAGAHRGLALREVLCGTRRK